MDQVSSIIFSVSIFRRCTHVFFATANAISYFLKFKSVAKHSPPLPDTEDLSGCRVVEADHEDVVGHPEGHPHQADAPAEFCHRYRAIAHASQIPPPPGRCASRILPQIQNYCACATNTTPNQADAPTEFFHRYRAIAHASQIQPPTRQTRQQNSSTDTELLRMRHKYHPHQADAPAEFCHRYRANAHVSKNAQLK